ncbi:hypothetical protein ACP275_14G130200 [Erythranthe tilingii]
MGCATSKLDDLPAVALCRDRCSFLDEAVRHRFSFAEAHAAYLLSLKSVGVSLDRFFNQDLDASSSLAASSSPLLNLPPPQGKGASSPAKIQHHLHSHSNSGSHLHFHSGSDDDESGSDSLHHHDASSPGHHQHPYGGGYIPDYGNPNLNFPGGGGGGGGFMNMSYMKKQTTASVVYTQRPMSLETMHMGESSASSSSYYPNYPNYLTNTNQNNGYQSYGAGGGYGSSYPPPPGAVVSSSKLPPAPPSPPRSSTWEFLNPFETFEKYYPAYTPSQDSREVREEEGIPDLEEDGGNEVVKKEVHGDRKLTDGVGRSSHSKAAASEEVAEVAKNDSELQHMVYKNAVDVEERPKERAFKARGGFKGDIEVVKEIQVQFDRASESGTELAKFLEVGKLPYKWKHITHHVPSKIFHLPWISKSSGNGDHVILDVDYDVELRSKNLSSTLHKLYLWEKKLFEEVKAEEKMRVLHERKSKKIKNMDERGAEANKVNATRTLVRSLSTKMNIAIQVVDKISVKINNLRDDELWPQLNEFIQGLTRMWKSMLECHHNQCQAIGEAKLLDTIAFRKHFSDSHFEATRQLEHDLVNWTLKFSYWISAQKGYVRALNNWLMKCLLYVPEETSDGIVPFSPSRIGAPQVFVVCNHWSQSLDRVSEKEAVDSMRDFASNVLQLWDRDKAEMRQRMLSNKDERKIKSLDKDDHKMQKEIQTLDKRMVMISSSVVYQSETTTTKGGSLQGSLQRVLEEMGKFTANSLKVYEELLQVIKEDHHIRHENEKVS